MANKKVLELQQRNEQLKRLVELSVTLNSTLDLDALLQLITTTATELLDCEAASILLFDEKHPRLFFAAATGSDPKKLAEVPVPIEGSLAGIIFRTSRSIILNDVEQDPRHYSLVSEHLHFHVQTLLGIPMLIKDRVMGVIEAVNKRDRSFSERDETVLSVIGVHAAIAINNARLLATTKQALNNAKEANQLKSNFLLLASRELRTPLGIIIGYASFLREDSREETSEHAQHVLSAALQMRSLVEDMTNLTMLETEGLMAIKPQDISVQSFLKTACSEIGEIASAREHKIVFAFQDEPILVRVDPEKMVIAFVNLLNNAIRFSPQGSEIIVGAAQLGDRIMAWIQDRGIGIPSDKLTKIFDGFYQSEPPNTRHYGGLGIGLTIAKGLIEAQGGKIWAESEGEGQGSTFKVLLPKA
ncbi:MAG: GAF domain-containing sensor histidine kinase [Chloroflexi bacterium]|nr:GAF domain-containing sensor histidine kinase [Chloroflexota bacterium]